ncbi:MULTISPECIES: ABC transporter ATP-binding protein [Rhodopseudomonas]|uniref:Peptide ABC transporter ATP-binding protein n=1 Tax=Rhodopseudomonas palustris TaxID=1076 RepID=A0A0D7E850_RHOPL|nr:MULTISPECIES: ABC transporter ATP-binding protein [Rhodopseudomonas]KIZ37054.1 peptide ABC transporter ATP-binding protein [Rhodopseudomonas palustris]MDF3810646.1 ABC transporter ATP-binding protein [Rhodopseudomonas sp. BAL398]WOK16532.1 ABC transporter ATP-binding protein [Rhodopseudomonas sp. BAL398]
MAAEIVPPGTPILSVENLEVSLFTRRGVLPALDGLSLKVISGETLAIVGESGCGKSLAALAVMRLLPVPPAKIVGGVVRFMGRDLAALSDREMQKVRGKDISMIFQDPMTSLNPVMTVGDQLIEVIRCHNDVSSKEARERAVALLRRVRIPDAERRLNDYPHQMSGGMSQRVMIAMAIACGPNLLIADEPTTALDVTIQAQILELMKELQADADMGLVIITHDLGVVAETADRVVVMYAGRKVEEAPVEALFERPLHPYTRGLLGATPSATGHRGDRLVEITGSVPALSDLPVGCAFQNRCPDVFDRCRAERPVLKELLPHRSVACFAAEKELSRDVASIGA